MPSQMANNWVLIETKSAKTPQNSSGVITIFQKPSKEILSGRFSFASPLANITNKRIFNMHVNSNQQYIGTGYGPLLYDIMIEFASKHGPGLISSVGAGEGVTSPAAEKVYKYYYEKRNDINKQALPQEYIQQLPSYSFQRTPPEEYPWLFCIFSKKSQPIINELKQQKKLVMRSISSNSSFYKRKQLDSENPSTFSAYMQAYKRGRVSSDEIKQKFKRA